MDRLNAEGHDESQYLPRGTPQVNPFRMQHGMVEWEGDSIKSTSWMPDKLYRNRAIEKTHLDTCLSFYTALITTAKVLKIGDVRGILNDKPDGLEAPPRDVYFSVMTQLPKPQSNMMLWVVSDDRNRGNIQLACKLLDTIVQAIDNTQRIIDSLAKSDNITTSPSAEVCQNLPRPVCP